MVHDWSGPCLNVPSSGWRGGLLVGGFLFFLVVTQFHPGAQEDNHPVIFTKYAQSDPWIMVHFGQFARVLVALGGFLVLHRAIEARAQVPLLARCALGATVASAALWTACKPWTG